MRREDGVPLAYERLLDALSEDILGADDEDVLASHGRGAARVVADALRSRLRPVCGQAGTAPTFPDPSPQPGPGPSPQHPERKP